MEGRGWAGWSGVNGGKWDNCNSIINKYIKKTQKKFFHRSNVFKNGFMAQTITIVFFMVSSFANR